MKGGIFDHDCPQVTLEALGREAWEPRERVDDPDSMTHCFQLLDLTEFFAMTATTTVVLNGSHGLGSFAGRRLGWTN